MIQIAAAKKATWRPFIGASLSELAILLSVLVPL